MLTFKSLQSAHIGKLVTPGYSLGTPPKPSEAGGARSPQSLVFSLEDNKRED